MVTAIVSQVDGAAKLDTFWRNFYLRGPMFYDPSGVIGGTLYQQPPGGVPFSRGWIIAPDQTIALPQFGHHPERVIAVIRELLDRVACEGSASTSCLHLEWDGDEPWLTVDKGWCGPGAASGPFDVIRGKLKLVRMVDGAVDLGPVECVAGDLAWNRVTDSSPDPSRIRRPSIAVVARPFILAMAVSMFA